MIQKLIIINVWEGKVDHFIYTTQMEMYILKEIISLKILLILLEGLYICLKMKDRYIYNKVNL